MKKTYLLFLLFFSSISSLYCQDFYSEPWQTYTLLTSRRLAKFSQYSDLANDFKKISRSTADSATILYEDAIRKLEKVATIKPKYDTSFANYHRKSTDLDWFFNCDLPSDINGLEASIQTNQNKQAYTPVDTLLALTIFDFCRFNSLRSDYYSSQIYAFTCLGVFANMYGKTSKLYIEALILYSITEDKRYNNDPFLLPWGSLIRYSEQRASNIYGETSDICLKALFASVKSNFESGWFAMADDCSLRLFAYIKKVKEKREIHADYLSKIGHLYLISTNTPENARECFKEASKIRNNLAINDKSKNEYDLACLLIIENKYEEARKILEEELSEIIKSKKVNRQTPFLFLRLAQIAYETKDFTTLKKAIERAEKLLKAIDTYPIEYYWLKAELLNSLQEHKKASELYKEAFARSYFENSDPQMYITGKKSIWYHLNKYGNEEADYCDLVITQILRRKMNNYNFFEQMLSESEKEFFKESNMKELNFFLNVLYRLPNTKNLGFLLDYYNNANNSIQRNKLLINKVKPENEADSILLENLQSVIIQEQELLYNSADNHQKLDTILGVKAYFESQLARRHGYKMHKDEIWEFGIIEDAKSNLKTNEVFIQLYPFYLLDNDLQKTDSLVYVAFCVTKTDSIIRFTFFKNGSQLENQFFHRYQNSLRAPDSEVYKDFWQPISQLFQDKKHLFVSVGGVYHKLNIGAIVQPNGRLLMEDYDVRIVTSARELIEQKEKKNYENTAVLVGNPTFNLAAPKQTALAANYTRSYTETPLFAWPTLTRGSIAPLPNTKAEVENIGKILQTKGFKTQTLLGEQALEEAVKSVKSPRILHIATHGFFEANVTKKDSLQADDFMGIQRAKAAENPLLRSGLLLAGAENYLKTKKLSNDHENGILTAYEAMNLDLENTELVVLSACETGLGEIKNGEGVYGLQRALRIAGAQSVLMSLWKVSDAPTKILMETFYDNWLTKGMNKHEALKQAQLSVRKMPQYTAPVNWAAFVLVE